MSDKDTRDMYPLSIWELHANQKILQSLHWNLLLHIHIRYKTVIDNKHVIKT